MFCLEAAYTILLAWLIYPHECAHVYTSNTTAAYWHWTGLDLVDDYCSSHLYICFLARYAADWAVSYLYSKQPAWFGWIELICVVAEARWRLGGETVQTLGWGGREKGIHPLTLRDETFSWFFFKSFTAAVSVFKVSVNV